jgi:hypothetical protein
MTTYFSLIDLRDTYLSFANETLYVASLGVRSNGSRVANFEASLLPRSGMGLGYPLLCVGDAMRFVRPPPGRRHADDRHHPSLRLDAGEPSGSALPGQTPVLRHDVRPGPGHTGPLPTRLPVVGRQLPSAHLQSRCRLVVI